MAKKTQSAQPIIRITALANGFRRAGMAHFGTEEYPLSRFSKAECEALLAEPNLRVQIIEPDKTAAGETGANAGDNAAPPAEPVGGAN